jgi:hypothetical protein
MAKLKSSLIAASIVNLAQPQQPASNAPVLKETK